MTQENIMTDQKFQVFTPNESKMTGSRMTLPFNRQHFDIYDGYDVAELEMIKANALAYARFIDDIIAVAQLNDKAAQAQKATDQAV